MSDNMIQGIRLMTLVVVFVALYLAKGVSR